MLNTKRSATKQDAASGLREWLQKDITRLLSKLCVGSAFMREAMKRQGEVSEM